MGQRILLALLVCAPLMADDAKIPPSEFTAAGHTTDKLEVVQQRVKNETAVLLDVREQHEWEAGHLKLAKLVPLSVVKSDMLTGPMKKHLSQDKPVYVHCGSGVRVLQISEILRPLGYDIRPLRSGFSKLCDVGFEVAAKPDSAETKESLGND